MRLIDADALLKRVQQEEIQAQIHGREFSTCFMSPGGTPSTEWWYIEDLIENAPTIEARKRGKWINHRNDEGHNIADCDQCGATIQWFDGDDMPIFCCMCGADMREEGGE